MTARVYVDFNALGMFHEGDLLYTSTDQPAGAPVVAYDADGSTCDGVVITSLGSRRLIRVDLSTWRDGDLVPP